MKTPIPAYEIVDNHGINSTAHYLLGDVTIQRLCRVFWALRVNGNIDSPEVISTELLNHLQTTHDLGGYSQKMRTELLKLSKPIKT